MKLNKFNSNVMSIEQELFESEEDARELMKTYCFPLRDYELIKVYECHMLIVDGLKVICDQLDKVKDDNWDERDVEEYNKAKKRAADFGCRFSRNYMYSYKLQLTNFSKLINNKKALEKGSSEALKKSITNLYQAALQAVQAYQAYILSKSRLQLKDKLKKLAETLKDMNELCQNILLPVMETVGRGTEELIVEMCDRILEKLLSSHKEKGSSKKLLKKVKACPSEHKNLLAMYEGKIGAWKRKAKTIAKLKAESEKRKVRAENELQGDKMKDNLLPRRKLSIERVGVETDVETEVQRFGILDENSRVGNDKVGSSEKPTQKLRSTLLEALRYTDRGDEASALAKLQDLIKVEKEQNVHKTENVQVICIRSKSMEEIPNGEGEPMLTTRSKKTEKRNQLDKKVDVEAEEEIDEIEEILEGQFKVITPTGLAQEQIKEKAIDDRWCLSPNSIHSLDGVKTVEEQGGGSSRRKLAPIFKKLEPAKRSELIPLTVSLEVLKESKKFVKKISNDGTIEPWEVVSSVSDALMNDIVSEVLAELVDDKYLHYICQNELQAM